MSERARDEATVEIVIQSRIEAGPADRLAAALDREDPPLAPGDALPPAWHWLYFVTARRASDLGTDGRGGADGLLPKYEGLARMWAGADLTFHRPIVVGDDVTQHARVAAIEAKSGRSGSLTLATIERELTSASGGLLVRERQNLVFRDMRPYAPPAEGRRATAKAVSRRVIMPSEVLLFQFSALSGNAHRIHYDWPYATEQEGYPGLVVHGPLTAILLLDLLSRTLPGRDVTAFECRAQRALFCNQPTVLCISAEVAGSVELWAEDASGFIAMRAAAKLAP